MKSLLLILPVIFFASCNETKKPPVEEKTIPLISYSVVNTFPHDTNAFTEGLLIHENKLFESTGSPQDMPETKSLFGIVDLKTGKIDKKVELDRNIYFGEGIVVFANKIYQLTYQNGYGFIYDAVSYKKIGQFSYKNKEGWGMTTDGTSLIMSDGSSDLTYLNPNTLEPVKTIPVYENDYLMGYLNELEYIKGYIYANIWMTNYIVKIDPKTGKIIGKIDLTSINNEVKNRYPKSMEMNGIAYDAVNDKIYVTGKMWPSIFEIKFAH
jgi:glutamine cyclotransferase